MSPKIDLSQTSAPSVVPEYFEHPTEGWLEYDPNTLYINPARQGHKPVNHPIAMTGKFFGTKQPMVPTCSEPSESNKGCPKWYGCPMKNFPHVGPGIVIMKKMGRRDMSHCYDFFETTRGGKPTSQSHHGLDGWELDVEHTTIPMKGRTEYIQKGTLDVESSAQAVKAAKPKVWEHEIGGLLAPWWPLMKKKGVALPAQADHYPELVDDSEEEKPKKRGRPSKSM